MFWVTLSKQDEEYAREEKKRRVDRARRNPRTFSRDTRAPDEITQEELDNVAEFSTKKVYCQIKVSDIHISLIDFVCIVACSSTGKSWNLLRRVVLTHREAAATSAVRRRWTRRRSAVDRTAGE